MQEQEVDTGIAVMELCGLAVSKVLPHCTPSVFHFFFTSCSFKRREGCFINDSFDPGVGSVVWSAGHHLKETPTVSEEPL